VREVTGIRARCAWGFPTLLCLLLAPPLAAQAPRVERVGAARVQAGPGERLTAVFRVVRPSSSAPIGIDVRLPRGWEPLSRAAGGDDASPLRLVPVAVPRNAAAGAYSVVLAASSGNATSADSVIVEVRERREVAVSLAQAPRFAAAGTEYATEFLVANRGNALSRIRLAVASTRQFPARIDAPALDLAAGASRTVRVVVLPPDRIDQQTIHLVTLRATVEGDTAAAEAESRVEVVPRAGRSAGPSVHRLPATVRLRGNADGSGDGVPGEVSVSGPLSPGGSTRLDVLIRGAGAASEMLGERDERSIGVRGRGFDLRLGDQTWQLSPLTEGARSGYGAGGRIGVGPLSLVGYSQANRRVAGSPRTLGLSAGVGGAENRLAAQYFRRGADSAAVSLRGLATPFRGMRMDAEYGVGQGASAGSRGMSAQLFGAFGRFVLDARAVRADAGFPGEQGGRRLDHAAVEVNPAGTLRLRGSYDREERDRPDSLLPDVPRDPAAPPPLPQAPRTESVRAGASLGAVSVDVRRERRESDEPGHEYARESRSVVASARVRRRGVSAGAGVESGVTEDRMSSSASPFLRAWVRSGVSLPRSQFLWASLERWTGGSDAGDERERLTGTLHLSLAATRSTRVDLMAQAYRDGEARDGSVDASLEQRLAFGHALRMRLRAYPWAQGRDPVVLLDYVVPLGIPLSRTAEPGSVSGRVVDAETGKPVAGAIVRVGGRAVLTDARGRWGVAGLAAGRYTVEIDPLTAGLGRVVLHPEALRVDLTGPGAPRLDVALARGARLTGTLALFDAPPGREDEARPAGGVEGAVMEMRGAGERRRRATDAAGRFEFADLRPGRWTVVVADADLPPNTRLEQDSAEVELAPGAERELSLRVLPRKREVRIVAGGELELNGAAATPSAPPARPERVALDRPSPSRPTPAASADPANRPADRPTSSSSDRPDRPDQPTRIDRPNPSYRPNPSDRPDQPDRTDRPSRPTTTIHAAPSRRPGPTIRPAPRTRSVEDERLAVAMEADRVDSIDGNEAASDAESADDEPFTIVVGAEDDEGRGDDVLPSGFRDWPNDTYTVQPGDRSITNIAWLAYRDGSLWPKIWVANRGRLPSPDRIAPGQVLRIPPKAPLTEEERAALHRYEAARRARPRR
jgi:nucleoid-associated protein YgaU